MLENWSSGFPTRSDTNQAVQPHKIVRGLKVWIKEEEGLYYLCSENKGADQLLGYCELICVFVFAYAKIPFSHDAAQIIRGRVGGGGGGGGGGQDGCERRIKNFSENSKNNFFFLFFFGGGGGWLSWVGSGWM